MARSAADPWQDGVPPHLPRPPEVPALWLLPGDPARVDIACGQLDDAEIVGHRREYRMGLGRFRGRAVGVCSTGIGGPSTEIAVVELARLGARTVVRVGGMGAFAADLTPGGIGVVASTTRESGAARFYLDGDQPCTADAALTAALLAGAAEAGRSSRAIRVSSLDGYYVGQGRPVAGWEDVAASRLAAIRSSGVDGVDMEAETVLSVGKALGLRAGAVLGVHGSRVSDSWYEEYESLQRDVVLTALTGYDILGQSTGPSAL